MHQIQKEFILVLDFSCRFESWNETLKMGVQALLLECEVIDPDVAPG